MENGEKKITEISKFLKVFISFHEIQSELLRGYDQKLFQSDIFWTRWNSIKILILEMIEVFSQFFDQICKVSVPS